MTFSHSSLQKHIEEKLYNKRRKRALWLKRRNLNKYLGGSKCNINYNELYPGRIIRFIPLTIKLFIKKGYLSTKYASKKIVVPSIFSFKDHYDETIDIIISIVERKSNA